MIHETLLKSASENPARRERRPNVGTSERVASVVAGGALIGYAVTSRSKLGMLIGLFGTGLVYRGATGNCEAYRNLGISTAQSKNSEEVARDTHVARSTTINRSPEELYSFWRNFQNLPRFMLNLQSVRMLGGNRFRWVANGPAGKPVEWEAEIYNEKENELIAWRSLPGSDVTNAGTVTFTRAPGGRGTCVRVTFNYNPPGGKPGALLARLFGAEPAQMVEQNLKRLKQLFETGEAATVSGQTSGRLVEEAAPAREREAHDTSEAPEHHLTHEAKGGVL